MDSDPRGELGFKDSNPRGGLGFRDSGIQGFTPQGWAGIQGFKDADPRGELGFMDSDPQRRAGIQRSTPPPQWTAGSQGLLILSLVVVVAWLVLSCVNLVQSSLLVERFPSHRTHHHHIPTSKTNTTDKTRETKMAKTMRRQRIRRTRAKQRLGLFWRPRLLGVLVGVFLSAWVVVMGRVGLLLAG